MTSGLRRQVLRAILVLLILKHHGVRALCESPGNKFVNVEDRWFYKSSTTKTFSLAAKVCEQLGTTLAYTIDNEKDARAIGGLAGWPNLTVKPRPIRHCLGRLGCACFGN